jgi:hypothetical protein
VKTKTQMPTGIVQWCKIGTNYELLDLDNNITLADVLKIDPEVWEVWLHFGEAYDANETPYQMGRYPKPLTARVVAEGAYFFHCREEWEKTQQALALLDAEEAQ